MRFTIIGGGNIGTLMAAEFAHKGHLVTMYTSKPLIWGNTLSVYTKEECLLFEADLIDVTHDLEQAVKFADIIWVTTPPSVFPKLSNQLDALDLNGKMLGIIPGSGGAEFTFARVVSRGCILFGFQRVHSIARLKKYGHSVYMLGRKKNLYLAAVPEHYTEDMCKLMEGLFDIPCIALPNYMSITLTPSNPILHTSRLYSLFKDYRSGIYYPRSYGFYDEWDDFASQIVLACDLELQNLCSLIPLDLTSVTSLKEHYESSTIKEMTDKIRSIDAFKGLLSPMKQVEAGWIPDFSSRYFVSDFDFGLKILIDIAHNYDVEVSTMEKIWTWYEKLVKKK